MNTEKLSIRLNTVAKYVPDQAKLADIGSDHAYLPCFLAKNRRISSAVAGEVAAGPFDSAKRQVIADGLSDKISVRMGDGLEVIGPGDADCITIAGMGGTLITSILERGKDRLQSVKRLVLQPNISAITIRKWLLDNSWELIEEDIVEEDGKIYEILVAEKGDPLKPYRDNCELELLLGPILLKTKKNAFKRKWQFEVKNWKRICKQLDNAEPSETTKRKKIELLEQISRVEEALHS